jgi:inhibitor of cysteine peptidase
MTEADNGKRICLETGDTLSLHLEGNPTTGFTWEITSKDDDCLQKAEQSYMSSSTLCGSGGMFSFTFRAASGGTSNLHLVYVRPWEKETLPPKTFEVTVTITSPKRHSTNLMP